MASRGRIYNIHSTTRQNTGERESMKKCYAVVHGFRGKWRGSGSSVVVYHDCRNKRRNIKGNVTAR
eukprot:3051958-Ditylum_brightwellii.AAC.1